jgi:hypothetical protein
MELIPELSVEYKFNVRNPSAAAFDIVMEETVGRHP